MAISKRLRFLVFRRDGYCCQYCGKRPPSVTLEVDHRIPRCAGGSDSLDNLVAACWDCNRGKGPLEGDGHGPEWKWKGYESWEHMMEEVVGGRELPDDLPRWLQPERGRRPLVLGFDYYAAAAELPRPDMELRYTREAFAAKSELF